MNAAKEVKKELAAVSDAECCKMAFLSGVIHTAGVISITREGMRIIIDSANPFLAGTVDGIVDGLFALDGNSLKTGSEKESLPEGKKIISGSFVQNMLLQLRIFKLRDGLKVVEGIDPYLIENDCCKRAYLAGAFSGGGAFFVAKGYHLEFSCTSKRLRDDIICLLEEFEIKAAALNRGEKYIAYIKDKEMISDCLALMGATKSVLRLNSLVAERSLSQEVSRAANCDMANLNRLVAASVKQQEAIKTLKNIKNTKLRETAEARLNLPDLSYGELAAILGISKGALKYRLERLVAMAEEIKK